MNKRITFSILAVLILTLGGSYAIWQSGLINDDDGRLENSSEPNTEADERERRAEEEAEENNSDEQPSDNQQEQPDDRQNITPTLSRVDQDANNVIIRAFVDGANEGTCTVVFEKTGYQAITRSASLSFQANYYVCEGFNVEKTAFPVKGEWKVRVDFSSPEAYGSSRTKTININ